MTCKYCEKPVDSRGMCSSHYMRFRRHGDPLASGHRGGSKKVEVGDICKNGHKIEGDNIAYRVDNRVVGKRLVCRICTRDRDRIKQQQKRDKKRAELAKLPPKPKPPKAPRVVKDVIDSTGTLEGLSLAKSIGIDLRTIRIKPRAVPLWEKFQTAREGRTDYNCYDREAEFIDYAEPPTKDEADALCASCPLLELCKEFAVAEQPGWGVWGSKTYGDFNKQEGEGK